ncbi:MAG: nucleotidyl transferase AbiEii/AbiGii toxin family protein [Patescibacteria group bacterium]|nr:nucleotidyl transferase AbiEii/AbiGii toxin family protein [Patescibacteria group bacterium]
MNKNISNLHLEVLDSKRQKLLKKLLLHAKDFTLGGGTALALYLAHRKSFDFDFFRDNPLSKNLLEKISETLEIKNIATDSSDELTFFTKNEVKVTFLHYPFKPYFEILDFENNLRLFNVKDIAVQKAYTIGRRGEYRDYFDLYSVFKNGYIKLPELISVAKKVYGSVFEEKIFLEQLVYFDDLLNFDVIPASSKPLPTKKEVKKFFGDIVKEYI